jgi:hypothetical protein
MSKTPTSERKSPPTWYLTSPEVLFTVRSPETDWNSSKLCQIQSFIPFTNRKTHLWIRWVEDCEPKIRLSDPHPSTTPAPSYQSGTLHELQGEGAEVDQQRLLGRDLSEPFKLMSVATAPTKLLNLIPPLSTPQPWVLKCDWWGWKRIWLQP